MKDLAKVAMAALVAVFFGSPLLVAVLPPRILRLPAHMLGPAVYEEGLLSVAQAATLRSLVKQIKDYPTNTNDLSFYKTRHEHIGEAQPIEAGGACADPFLVPNGNRTLCVLPGRIDIARHFILTGGPMEGLREPYESLASRVQSFGAYMFNLSEYPEVGKLFDSPRFLQLARRVCPPSKQHLDPFQFNFIIQLPGQTVTVTAALILIGRPEPNTTCPNTNPTSSPDHDPTLTRTPTLPLPQTTTPHSPEDQTYP